MMYKLINRQTSEQYLCDKVTIDGYDYYVKDNPKGGRYIIWLGETVEHFPKQGTPQINYGTVIISTVYSGGHAKDWKEIVATTNPNIDDVPKVVDEVERLASNVISCSTNVDIQLVKEVWKAGYNKSQETHPFSEEDMIEFGDWVYRSQFDVEGYTQDKETKELLQLWKEQKPKTLYYE